MLVRKGPSLEENGGYLGIHLADPQVRQAVRRVKQRSNVVTPFDGLEQQDDGHRDE